MNELPIVYCRGYAGPTSQIDSTVNDPFYGFNEGATHTRVNGDGDPNTRSDPPSPAQRRVLQFCVSV
ncbi:hypothetical protein ACPPVW_12380 [Leifsonia sp. McL0607]|uniref:hypothetical protein n=1 Tax=Leifsonia sp. McL0607 TaxID=3415672 RepID=UPI003CFB40CC